MSQLKAKDYIAVWSALLIIQFGFGAYGIVVTKFAKNANADPLVFCLVRDGGCCPVLFLAAFVAEKKIMVPEKKDLPLLILLGILGMFCNQLFYILGIYYTSANTASIFQPAIPVWASIVAVLARIEPLPPLRTIHGWAKVLGVICAASGAVVMTVFRDNGSKNSQKQGWKQGLGYVFLMANTLAMAVYVVVQKKFVFNVPTSRWKTSPVALTAWSYVFGFLSMALASIYYANQPNKFSIPTQAVYPLIYAVFIASGLCYLLITWCNSMISTSLVTATWPLQVLFCIILAYFVLGESLVPGQGAGGLLIIIGLLAVVWANYKEENYARCSKLGSPRKTNLGGTDHLINKE